MGDDAAGAGWAGCALVVPAGGGSRRMGSDKLAAPLGASTVLGEMLARVPPGVPVAVVGPTRPLPTDARPDRVVTACEDPPGGGPAAAAAAGLEALAAAGALDGVDVVVVLAGDAPWAPLAVPAVVAALRCAPPGTGCAVAVDADGRLQVLLAAHRSGSLRARLAPGVAPAGRPARWLVGEDPVTVAVPADLLADVDTPEQLTVARSRQP